MLKDWFHDLEYLEMVHDLMDHSDVQRLANYTHHHITTRLAHSIGVSYRSYRWAKRLGSVSYTHLTLPTNREV